MEEGGLRQRASEHRRQRILAVATELFAAQGFKKTSAQAVADAAGVSKGLVFLFFNNKLGLFEAVIEELMVGWALHTDRQVAKVLGNTAAELDAYIRASLEYILSEPLLVAVLRDEERPQVAHAMNNAQNYGVDNISKVLRRGIKEGVFRQDIDPVTTTQVLLDLISGMMERHCRSKKRTTNKRQLDAAMAFVQNAILT